MNVIFLDIDGVLNCAESKSKCGHIVGIDDSRVKILKDIVIKTNANIVLTSSWKLDWDKDYEKCTEDGKYLFNKLAKEGLFIFDKTIDDNPFCRCEGICRWLNTHNVNHWVVLDDEYFDFNINIFDHLVHTDFYDYGLERRHINMALEIMRK